MATSPRRSFFASLIDPLKSTASRAGFEPNISQRTWGLPLLLGVALTVVSLVGWVVDPAQFYFSYLIAWLFCLTISLGALFFVMVHHVVRAHWNVVVRRVPEVLAWTFPMLALFALPILLPDAMHTLFHWTHSELYDPTNAHFDAVLAGKQAYLNAPFFYARFVLYFAVWTFLAYKMYTLSVIQDIRPSSETSGKLLFHSAWGLIAYALTLAFAAFDYIMSLDPHWYSTIFGVYVWAGAFMASVAVIILLYLSLQRAGALEGVVSTEHYHDLGKFLFAWTAFWAYIAFAQFMLIWYGNIPEETIWYRHRLEHGWQWFSDLLVFGHFVVPFAYLMFRRVKRSPVLLAIGAVWMLIMQWIDIFWMVMPTLDNMLGTPAGFHWLDFTCWFGLFGLYLGFALYMLSRHALAPQNDARLPDSLRFVNA